MPITAPRSLAAAVLLSLVTLSCADRVTAPATAALHVVVRTAGGDLDMDGYDLLVGADRHHLPANGTVTLVIPSGTHVLSLEGVQGNCDVGDPHPLSVPAAPGQSVDVVLRVQCHATGVEVVAHAVGSHAPRRVQVIVGDDAPSRLDTSVTLVRSGLAPGAHRIALSVAGEHCTVAGGAERTVEVTSRVLTPVVFDVACLGSPVRREKLAYVHGDWVVIANPDGSASERLEQGGTPSWSPDGSQLVYSTAQCVQPWDWYWYYYGLDSEWQCTGGLLVTDPETGALRSLPGGAAGFEPAWAPDGQWIAFVRCCSESLSADGHLYLLPAGDSTAAPVPISVATFGRDPAWSPDGQRIAFTCPAPPPGAAHRDICVVNRDGSNLVRLTADEARDSRPAWSPDGSRVAFERDDRIAVVTLGSSEVSILTFGSDPAWSRDGTSLVFAGAGGLFVIGADGSDRRRLTSGGHGAPAWRP